MIRKNCIKKFFSAVESKKAAAYYRQEARKEGKSLKVETLDALQLIRLNPYLMETYFKGLAKPVPGEVVVILCFDDTAPAVVKPLIVKKTRVERSCPQANRKPFAFERITVKRIGKSIVKVLRSVLIILSPSTPSMGFPLAVRIAA